MRIPLQCILEVTYYFHIRKHISCHSFVHLNLITTCGITPSGYLVLVLWPGRGRGYIRTPMDISAGADIAGVPVPAEVRKVWDVRGGAEIALPPLLHHDTTATHAVAVQNR